MKTRRWTTAVFCSVAVVLGLALATGRLPWASAAEDDTKSLEGKAAPEVSLTTVDGKPFKLSEQKKSVVVLDFWATWCPPCRLSLPHIQELSQKKDLADKGLKVFAVNSQEDKETVDGFLKKNKYSFTVPMDAEGAAATAYAVRGIPTTVVVGRDGTVKKIMVGFNPEKTPKELDEAVESALKEEAK